MIRRSAPSAAEPVFTDQKDQDDNGKRKSARTQCDASIKLIFRQLKHIISLTFVLFGARRVLMIVTGSRTLFLAPDEQKDEAPRIRLANHGTHPVIINLGENIYENATSISPTRIIVDDHELGPEWHGKECTPMRKWQLPQFGPSTCNKLHEMSFDDLSLINCGGSRCAFEVHDTNGLAVVLKTPKYQDTYSEGSYYNSWKDTIAMERLGHSPFVLDLFGNCGVSQLTEIAEGASLHDLIKIARQNDSDFIASPTNILRIGFHVASAVGHLHSFDTDEVPSISHNDLCCHQYLLIDGVYKLNDFHLSSIILKNSEGNACLEEPARMNRNLDKMRAPEELLNRGTGRIRRDKVDVWLMGNILYTMLAKKWWFEGRTTSTAREAIKSGNHSELPPEILNNTNPAVQTLIKAINMAWTFDPNDRPCAQEIAIMMKEALEKLDGGDDGIWRVSIPPLLQDHRYTDSDFYNNLLQ